MALERNQLNTAALCGASVFSGVYLVPLAPVKIFLLQMAEKKVISLL